MNPERLSPRGVVDTVFHRACVRGWGGAYPDYPITAENEEKTDQSQVRYQNVRVDDRSGRSKIKKKKCFLS